MCVSPVLGFEQIPDGKAQSCVTFCSVTPYCPQLPGPGPALCPSQKSDWRKVFLASVCIGFGSLVNRREHSVQPDARSSHLPNKITVTEMKYKP